MLGRVTRRKMAKPPAPSEAAASSSSRPCACISGISSRATKGKVTNSVASTMPGVANSTCTPCACNQAPNQPWAPNNSTSTKPATTGETASGRSMKASSRRLPGNSNLATAQAVARPSSAFTGTAMAATSRVRRIAARVSGSSTAAK